jgi:hypothetical protein
MSRTPEQRTRDQQLVEKALFGELLPKLYRGRDRSGRFLGGRSSVIHCKVVGVTHNNAGGRSRQKIIETMTQFEFVDLKWEPCEWDPNAIQVLYRGEQIGHLPADLAADLAPRIGAGEPWSAITTRVGGSYTLGVSHMLFRRAEG